MLRGLRVPAVLCAVIAIAALTAALVSGETEPIVGDIVLDGAIRPPAHEPEVIQDEVVAPPTGVEIEQVQPAPTVPPPTPAPVDAVAPPIQPLPPVPPAVIFVPPAEDPADDPLDDVDPPDGDADPDD